MYLDFFFFVQQFTLSLQVLALMLILCLNKRG